jgi:hypothetical protein
MVWMMLEHSKNAIGNDISAWLGMTNIPNFPILNLYLQKNLLAARFKPPDI